MKWFACVKYNCLICLLMRVRKRIEQIYVSILVNFIFMSPIRTILKTQKVAATINHA